VWFRDDAVAEAAMSIETHIHDAITRVEREIGHFDDRLAGVERFEREVRDIQPTAGQPGGPPATDGGVRTVSAGIATDSDGSRCRAVRELFAETIYPHSVTESDEHLLRTIGEELTEQVSLALAPGTDQRFTPPVKRTVLSATAERQAEIESMQQALDAERESLETAREETRQVTDWLCEVDQTSLLELGFEELCERHRTLEEHLQRCERLAETRQETVHSTSSTAGAAGVDHHQLIRFLYQSFPVSYPVLATVTNLEDVCRTGQQRVRDHLVRRV